MCPGVEDKSLRVWGPNGKGIHSCTVAILATDEELHHLELRVEGYSLMDSDDKLWQSHLKLIIAATAFFLLDCLSNRRH